MEENKTCLLVLKRMLSSSYGLQLFGFIEKVLYSILQISSANEG